MTVDELLMQLPEREKQMMYRLWTDPPYRVARSEERTTVSKSTRLPPKLVRMAEEYLASGQTSYLTFSDLLRDGLYQVLMRATARGELDPVESLLVRAENLAQRFRRVEHRMTSVAQEQIDREQRGKLEQAREIGNLLQLSIAQADELFGPHIRQAVEPIITAGRVGAFDLEQEGGTDDDPEASFEVDWEGTCKVV